jgi:hypothetical protein
MISWVGLQKHRKRMSELTNKIASNEKLSEPHRKQQKSDKKISSMGENLYYLFT